MGHKNEKYITSFHNKNNTEYLSNIKQHEECEGRKGLSALEDKASFQ